MKKIILTHDIVLTAEDLTPGLSGELLVQQDNIGGHIVTLGERNMGFVEVLKQPNTVTLLSWRNDDTLTYWNADYLTPEQTIAPPTTITDLAVDNIDTINALLKWTAPNGNYNGEQPTAVDRYTIYYSMAPITEDTIINNLVRYAQTMVPKVAGQQESLLLTGLKPNTFYSFVIISDKTTFGTKRVSQQSNVVNFRTVSSNAEAQHPGWIFLNQKDAFIGGRYGWKMVRDSDYDINFTDNIVNDATWAITYDNVTNNNGMLAGTPINATESYNYGMFFPSWYNTPSIRIIYPLNGTYQINQFYFLGVEGQNFSFSVKTSSDMVNWALAVNMDLPRDQDSNNAANWSNWPVLEAAQHNVKYIALEIKQAYFIFKGIAFFGKKEENTPMTGFKFKRPSMFPQEFNKMLGTNGFFIEDLDNMKQIGYFNRFYNNFNWFTTDNGTYDKGCTVPIDQIGLQFSTSRMWDFDAQMQYITNNNMEILFTMNDEIIWLAPGDYQKDPMYRKSINRGLEDNNIANTLNANNWSDFARIVYNFVARYGSNINVDTQYLTLSPGYPAYPVNNPQHNPEPLKVGLNYVKWWEWGNEIDKYWKDQEGYYNPQEMAMRCSVAWDGHKGALGNGFGMLQADPNSKQALPGLSNVNPGYVREMISWFDVNRGIGDYPIHAINFHFYNSNQGSQGFSMYDYSIEIFGVQPEWAGLRQYVKDWVEMRDRYAPSMELWISEIGWDEHNDGAYSPNIDDVVTRHVTKAQWQIRGFMLCYAYGVDRVMEYFFRHTNANDVWPQDTNQKARDTFMTSGYLVPQSSGPNYWLSIPTEAWWYMTAFRNEFVGYRFLHFLREYGNDVSTLNPIETYNPNLFTLAFENINTNETCLVLWLAPITQAPFLTSQMTAPVTVRVDDSEVSVNVVDFINMHVSKTKAGNHSTINSIVSGDNSKRITVNVTETPMIIKTKNVGKKRLIDPDGFTVQNLSTTSVKLVWGDKNIGLNKTKIFMSQQNDQNFTVIFDDYIDNGEYIKSTDLIEGETYYFKIQFEKDGAFSNITDIIGVQMGKTIAVPTNFHTTQTKATSVTLAWDYGDTSLVNVFEIYRSAAADGIYNLVGTTDPNTMTYTDIGLTPTTQYFYKLRAKGQFDASLYTMAIAVTTDEASQLPPQLLTTKSTYSGDAIVLAFDLPMANPTGNEGQFTVIDYPNGDTNNPLLINAISIALNANDPQKLTLYLEKSVSSNTSLIKLSYNGNIGTVQSQFGVKLESFSAQTVINNFENESLILNRYQVRVTSPSSTSAVGWEDLLFNFQNTPATRQPYIINVKNTSGVTSSKGVIIPYHYPEFDIMMQPETIVDPTHAEPYPIEKWFPFTAVTQGAPIIWAPAVDQTNNFDTWSAVVFTNLDPTKLYNVRALVRRDYFGSPQKVRAELIGISNTFKVVDSSKPTETGIYYSNIKPAIVDIPTLPDIGAISMPNMDKPKIAMKFQTVNINQYFEAIILEELVNI